MVGGAVMMSLGLKVELGHTMLMVYLAEDMSICGTWSKRGEGVEAFVNGKYTHIFFVSSKLSAKRGLSRLRGTNCLPPRLSTCRWLSHLRGVVSRQANVVAKVSSNSQGLLVSIEVIVTL